MAQPAALNLDGGDPRTSVHGPDATEYPTPVLRNLHDPSVTIEQYFYWAKITREEEKGVARLKHPIKKVLGLRKEDDITTTATHAQNSVASEKATTEPPVISLHHTDNAANEERQNTGASGPIQSSMTTDEEWLQATRAAKTATWGAVFYLITTDILGPYSVPYV